MAYDKVPACRREDGLLKMNYDLHIHTVYSGCCGDPGQIPENIFRIAVQKGIRVIGFADHLWQNPDHDTWPRDLNGTNPEIIDRLRAMIRETEIPEGLTVLVGAEAEMLDLDVFSITPDFAASLDFVLMPTNHLHQSYVPKPQVRTPDAYARYLLERFAAGARSGLATALAHPMMPFDAMDLFAPCILGCDESALNDTFALAAEHNVLYELNASPSFDRGTAEYDAVLKLIGCAKNAGCRFMFGTDAHSREGLQKNTGALDAVINDAGLVEDDFPSLPEIMNRKYCRLK